jgi:hypothetical protein
VCLFINTLITALGHLLTPSVNADIRDYQQYITGERVDGMFAAVGLIGNVITMVTGSVLPMIYEKAGLNEQTAAALGYSTSNVYEVLNNREYFISICTVLIIASIIGAALNVIPYFFFDFTETKQKSTISVLKIRALFEDYANGVLAEEKLVEAVEIIKEAEAYFARTPNNLSGAKEVLKQARAKSRAEYSATKAELRRQKEENEKIEIAKFVIDELRKFTTPEGIDELENAKAFAAKGLNGFLEMQVPDRAKAKAMPKSTELEKNRRSRTLGLIGDMKTAKKAAEKYYPNGIEEFDISRFDKLFKAEDEAQARFLETAKKLKEAKESGNAHEIKKHNGKLKAIKKEKLDIAKKIKLATNDNSVYHRAAKPYLDAVRIVKQAENYSRLDEIKRLYEEVNV